jgi:hypothetical protein
MHLAVCHYCKVAPFLMPFRSCGISYEEQEEERGGGLG